MSLNITQTNQPDANNPRKKIDYPRPLMSSTPGLNAGDFIACFNIVEQIDHHLTNRTRHFYRGDRLLTTLDEVVLAILDGALS